MVALSQLKAFFFNFHCKPSAYDPSLQSMAGARASFFNNI